MKKQIKKYGGTFVVTFNREDLNVNNLKVGDVVEVNKFVEVKEVPNIISDKKIEDMSNALIKKDGN